MLLPETLPNFSFITRRNMVPGTFHFYFQLNKIRSKTLNLINLQFLTLCVSVLTVSFKQALFKEKTFISIADAFDQPFQAGLKHSAS